MAGKSIPAQLVSCCDEDLKDVTASSWPGKKQRELTDLIGSKLRWAGTSPGGRGLTEKIQGRSHPQNKNEQTNK